MKFNLKSIPCYVTSDNQTHTTLKEAKLHEAGIALFAQFANGTIQGAPSNGDTKRVCLLIAKHYSKCADIFAAIRRANQS